MSKAEKIQDYYIGVIEGMRKKVVEIQSLEQEIYKEKLEQFSDKYSEKLENSNLRMKSVEKSRKRMKIQLENTKKKMLGMQIENDLKTKTLFPSDRTVIQQKRVQTSLVELDAKMSATVYRIIRVGD